MEQLLLLLLSILCGVSQFCGFGAVKPSKMAQMIKVRSVLKNSNFSGSLYLHISCSKPQADLEQIYL